MLLFCSPLWTGPSIMGGEINSIHQLFVSLGPLMPPFIARGGFINVCGLDLSPLAWHWIKTLLFLHRFCFFPPFSFFGANSLPANSAIIPTKINCYGEGDARQREPMGTLQTGVYYSEFMSAGCRQKEWGCFKEAKTLNGGAVIVIFIGWYSKPLGSGSLKSTTLCKKTDQSGFDRLEISWILV